jgi:hypothetical protein
MALPQKKRRRKTDIFAVLEEGYFINKWGHLKKPIALKPQWKIDIIRAYADFAAFCAMNLEFRPFLIAGSLLGIIRDGDLLPHDDDIDVGYFSLQRHAEGVRNEMLSRMIALARAGWRIKPSHNGGSFKVIAGKGLSFAVFPSWWEEDHVWLPQSQSMPDGSSLLHPSIASEFMGHSIFIPNRSEDYLAHHYGPTWRTPDPNYVERKKRGTLRTFKRARLTKKQRDRFSRLLKKLRRRRLRNELHQGKVSV